MVRHRKALNVIFVAFIFSLIPVYLSSDISSRVEGIVTDKDTGKPIPGAKVTLVREAWEDREWETTTDTKGYFKFDIKAHNLNYYIKCHKEGYVPFLPEYYYSASHLKKEYRSDTLKIFYLKQGQIKHIRVSLEKGGAIHGNISVDDGSGATPFQNLYIALYQKKASEIKILKGRNIRIAGMRSNENGEYKFSGLEPGRDYIIKFRWIGHVFPQIKHVQVTKNSMTRIDKTFILTRKTGIRGQVKYKGYIPRVLEVELLPENPLPDDVYWTGRCKTNEIGNYSCYGLPPGIYDMRIFAYAKEPKYEYKRKKLLVEIKSNEVKIMNFIL